MTFCVRSCLDTGRSCHLLKKVLSGCRSPLLKHLVSHRSLVYMILNNRGEELEFGLRVRVDGFDYVLFVSSAAMKCFGCGEEGHIIKNVSAPG